MPDPEGVAGSVWAGIAGAAMRAIDVARAAGGSAVTTASGPDQAVSRSQAAVPTGIASMIARPAHAAR